MAKIYISYSSVDKEVAFDISDGLKDAGHEILIDTQELTPGVDWRKKLNDALKSADGIIVVITEASLHSSFVLSEIGAARTYLDIEKSKFLIPVIFDRIAVPPILQDIQCLFGERNLIAEVISKIHSAINYFLVKKEAELNQKEAEIKKIESNASIYVEQAMIKLRHRESRNKYIGNIWYAIGFACLIGGVIFAIFGLKDFINIAAFSQSSQWTVVTVLAIKTTVIIGLLIAGSRYSFTLGKSYINEALKNADRSHAISFGKFYLDAYGATAKWEDLKEAFQYWNINNESSFLKLDTNQYDPRFAEMIIELSKVVTSKGEKK